MALRFAILTALTERESTGLDLARRFDRAFGFFWSASHQQIYRELDRLNRDELIEERESSTPERGRPRRFAITSSGEQALREWVSETEDPGAPRDTMMVRLRAAAAIDDPVAARSSIEQNLRVHEQSYETYLAIEKRDFAGPLDAAGRLRYQVLKAGIVTERARLEWCRETLAMLDEIEAG